MAKLIICRIDKLICDLNKDAKGCRYIPNKCWKGICEDRLQVKLFGKELEELKRKSHDRKAENR